MEAGRFDGIIIWNSHKLRGLRLWEPPADSFYYHTGTALVQELDDEYGVKVDYMAGKRRYMPDEEVEGDKYRYYVKDQLGSVVMMTDHERNTEHYNYDAWGEHTDTANLPPTENNVRYGGARVECFAKSVTSTDAIYLCGERHYWPAYGRFLQRDRMGYEKLPAPSNPLGANPYIYAENNPVMKKDLSGLQPAGYYRGARMGSESFYIGTEMPPESQMYDCCGNMRYNSLSAQEVAMSPVWNEKLGGTARFSWWQKRAGWSTDLCKAKPGEGQPNETCKAITAATPDLMCTYLEQCKHLSCPPWKGGVCPTGMADANYGYESSALLGAWWFLMAAYKGEYAPVEQCVPTGRIDPQLVECWQETLRNNYGTAHTGLTQANAMNWIGLLSMGGLASGVAVVFGILSPNLNELSEELVQVNPESFCKAVADCLYGEDAYTEEYNSFLALCKSSIDFANQQGQWGGEIPGALFEESAW